MAVRQFVQIIARRTWRKAVPDIGHKPQDHVACCDSALLLTKHYDISSRVGMAMKFDVKIMRFISQHLGIIERDRRQFRDIVLQLGSIRLDLPNLLLS